jgi:hypothetical protein
MNIVHIQVPDRFGRKTGGLEMDLVLDLNGLGTGKDREREEEQRHAGWLSWSVRLALALAAIGAAYLVMSDRISLGVFDRLAESITRSTNPIGALMARLPDAA